MNTSTSILPPALKAVEARRPDMRRILVHMCCGPCSIVPIKAMLGGVNPAPEVWGFFHNPNIHPLSEFRKRLDAAKKLATLMGVNAIFDEVYRPTDFIKGIKKTRNHVENIAFPDKSSRCGFCYSTRLEATARAAVENGFDAFSSSLLYSRYQEHDAIKATGFELSAKYGISFFYSDYRAGWQSGIDASKEMGLYRQKYCGCIYSKIERYRRTPP